jgi:KipI family sensor histidine kinase inhibitor
VKVDRLGDRALRVEVGDLDAVHRLVAAIGGSVPGVVDVIPAWRTVTIRLDPTADLDDIASTVEALDLREAPTPASREHLLPVRYDGADLEAVAGRAGMSVDELVARHTEATYTVAFLGFVPGFAYLSGLDQGLATPRRPTPRRSVGAGAVGIADDVTGVYPTDSPGGWNLLGHTAVTLFDVRADPPSLLAPGDVVRFEAM